MNDLRTKSFLSYVELKKQALKDLQQCPPPDLEARGATRIEEENLSQFFDEIGPIQSEIEDIASLLVDIEHLKEESKSVHSVKVLRGLRDRIDSDKVAILRKAKIIKARLEALDHANLTNRNLGNCFGEGSPVDRTRMSVINGLRTKLREMMNDFQSLRDRIMAEHKESMKRRYFNATGKVVTDEVIGKMISAGGQVEFLDQKGELDVEMQERQKAVSDIQRSLMQLHQVFLDMAVKVEAQDEQLNDIEENVVRAKDYISGGTDRLVSVNAMRKAQLSQSQEKMPHRFEVSILTNGRGLFIVGQSKFTSTTHDETVDSIPDILMSTVTYTGDLNIRMMRGSCSAPQTIAGGFQAKWCHFNQFLQDYILASVTIFSSQLRVPIHDILGYPAPGSVQLDPRLAVADINIYLEGIGFLSGRFLLTESDAKSECYLFRGSLCGYCNNGHHGFPDCNIWVQGHLDWIEIRMSRDPVSESALVNHNGTSSGTVPEFGLSNQAGTSTWSCL